MYELRALRHEVALSQQEFAALLGVPVDTFRMWGSGLRSLQPDVVARARAVVAEHQRRHELLALDVLAVEFGMHPRTLRDAVRAGRLEVQLSTRSAFGRPIRRATRAAVRAYEERYYRRSYSRTMQKPPIPAPVNLPVDYAERVTLTVIGCDSRSLNSRNGSARPTRLWCINGSRGSASRHRCSGRIVAVAQTIGVILAMRYTPALTIVAE